MQYRKAVRIGLITAMGFFMQGAVLAEADYPAAYFEPYIIYQAPEITGTEASPVESDGSEEPSTDAALASGEVDPYPAAYLQPVVVYQDKELIAALAKRQKTVRVQASAKVKVVANKPQYSKTTPATSPITDDGGVPISVLILIVALAGGFFWLIHKGKNEVAGEVSTAKTGEVADNEEDRDSDNSTAQAEDDINPN